MVYECWTEDTYLYSAFAICNDEGKLIVAETKVDYPFKLHKADDIFVIDEKAIFISGLKDGKIACYVATVN